MGSPIVHFEIVGKDGERLEAFYKKLFDWKIERQTPGGFQYGHIKKGEAGPISGGIRHEPKGKADVVVYFAVEDVEAAVKSAQSLGATLHVPPREFGDLKFAVIRDPEGNSIGVIEKN
ncbi:MAG: VOC family protein [Sphingomonadales bacterium]